MSKRPKDSGRLGGLGKQLHKMQREMVKAQQELADQTVEVTAGGGAITVVMTGHQRVQSITIQPQVIDPADPEMLQDLLVVALNQAVEQSRAMATQRLQGLTDGLNIPGLGL